MNHTKLMHCCLLLHVTQGDMKPGFLTEIRECQAMDYLHVWTDTGNLALTSK